MNADVRAHGLNNREIGHKLEELNARMFMERPDAHKTSSWSTGGRN
jgi:hypothetical protein